MNNDITPSELREWRKKEGLTQTELGAMIGLDKYAITTIETDRRYISAPEQRLLKLLIRGELPFSDRTRPWDPQVDFTETEWSMMTRIAHREGFHSPRPWIISKIRGYLSMVEPDEAAAEDKNPYNSDKKTS